MVRLFRAVVPALVASMTSYRSAMKHDTDDLVEHRRHPGRQRKTGQGPASQLASATSGVIVDRLIAKGAVVLSGRQVTAP